jgi:DNA-directed RNA polymerase specialized sigma24 family protein
MVMAHLSTIKLLREWARWGEAHNISYPTLSPMFGERALKMPLFGIGHVPDDIMRIEQAVCAVEWLYRQAIILRYHRRMGYREMGRRINCDWRTARRRLKTAEDEVHHKLQKQLVSDAPTHVHFGAQ